MSKKEQKIKELKEKMIAYETYAINNNCHRKPEKGVNSGADGRLYEPLVKFALGNYGFKTLVAKSNYKDTRKGGKTFEIKQGCPELIALDEKGNVIKSIFNNDFIIYAPDYLPGDDVRYVSWVFTSDEFKQALDEADLWRYKTSSYQYSRKRAGLEWFCDRISIQSYKNSQKKYNLWTETIAKIGKPFDEWLEENGIKSIEL